MRSGSRALLPLPTPTPKWLFAVLEGCSLRLRCKGRRAFWLHHTESLPPRGCLSLSVWADHPNHSDLLALLREDLPVPKPPFQEKKGTVLEQESLPFLDMLLQEQTGPPLSLPFTVATHWSVLILPSPSSCRRSTTRPGHRRCSSGTSPSTADSPQSHSTCCGWPPQSKLTGHRWPRCCMPAMLPHFRPLPLLLQPAAALRCG